MSESTYLKRFTIVSYTFLCVIAFFLVDSELIPYPYSKVPLGAIMALMYVGPLILLSKKGQWLRTPEFLLIALLMCLGFHLHGLFPSDLEGLHITLVISKVSLGVGFAVGALVLLALKYLSRTKSKAPKSAVAG